MICIHGSPRRCGELWRGANRLSRLAGFLKVMLKKRDSRKNDDKSEICVFSSRDGKVLGAGNQSLLTIQG
jgi:hypothetical protein